MADETLEWDLKVDADTSGGTKMDAVLTKLDLTMNLLQFHLQHIEENTRKVGRAHDEHGKKADGLLGVLKRVVHQGMEPLLHKWKEIAEFSFVSHMTEKLIELPGEMAHEVAHLAEEMMHAAMAEERMSRAFENAMGTEAAHKAEHYIERIRKNTEFTKTELEGMNLELAKSGFAGAGLARANEALIDLASMSANPQEGASAAMGALKRVASSGRLDVRALRPFGISEKTFFDELARENGMTVEAAKKRMEKGKLDIETTLNSLYTVITNKTGKGLGGAGADMGNLLSTRLKNLKEIPELMGEKLKDTKGFSDISDFVGRLGEAFDPDSELGQKVFTGMEKIIDTIGEQLAGIDLNSVVETVTEDIIPAIQSIAEELGDVIEAVQRVIRGFHEMHDLVFGAKPKSSALDEFDQAAKRGQAALDKEKKEAENPSWLNRNALADGTKKATAHFEGAGTEFGAAVEKGFRNKTRTHSPSALFEELGGDVAAGFAGGVRDGTAEVQRVFDRMAVPSGLGAGGGGSAGGIEVHLHQTNNINGASGSEQIADDIVAKINEVVPGALQSALEQMAMQTGSAA